MKNFSSKKRKKIFLLLRMLYSWENGSMSICINNNTITPYKLKKLASIGELGDPHVYRFMQDETPT